MTYSVSIAQGSIAGGATGGVVTVPAGYIWVVRDVLVSANALQTCTLEIGVGPSGPGVMWVIIVPSSGASQQWSGRQVLNAGQTLTFRAVGTNPAYYMVSGYQLTAN